MNEEAGERMIETVRIPAGEYAALLRDKARLDWLDKCNRLLNEHCGSNYGWKLVRSHLVNRLMRDKRAAEGGAVSDVDLHDSAAGYAKLASCRDAIDEGMRAEALAATPERCPPG